MRLDVGLSGLIGWPFVLLYHGKTRRFLHNDIRAMKPPAEGTIWLEEPRAIIESRLRHAWPLGTILIIALTSCITLSQFIFPEVLELLRRSPLALRDGEWWRAVTPLLVHSNGLVQFMPNIAGIAVVGTFLETKFDAWRMLVIYLAGGVAGEVAGYLWQPHGAGASVGLFGLIGATGIAVLRGPLAPPPFTAQVVVGFAAAGKGISLAGPACGAVLVLLACLPVGFLLRNRHRSRLVARGIAVFILIAGLALSVLGNIHGPPVLAGASIGLARMARES